MNQTLIFNIVEIILSVIVTALILLQARGVGLSRSFGGVGGFYRSKRGLEKVIFVSTIVFSILFAIVLLANLYFR